MNIGFSAANITPSYGMERPGGTGKAYHMGVHDECWASACVMDDGDNAIAVVGLDALSVQRSIVQGAREIITEAIGMPGEHVMVGASHTHSGGPIVEGGFAAEADPDYCRHVTRQIAGAVIDANRRAEDLRIGVGVGEAPGVAHYRRWYLTDGTMWSHPGSARREDMDRPHGELDPSVGVVGATDADGNPRGAIVNFTCHGTTGLGVGGTSSSDWIHFVRRALKGAFGEDFGVVVVNGACGDITQVDNTDTSEQPRSGPIAARKVGMTVGGEAIKTLLQMDFADHMPVAGKTELIKLAPHDITPEMLAWAEAHLDSDALVEGRWFPDKLWAREWIEMAKLNETEPEMAAELQALTVGEAAFVSSPAEYFCALGNDIKRRSEFQPTFVVELANGCVGYVGTRDAYPDDFIPREDKLYTGGYETTPARSSRCAPGAGEQIADACVELVNSMDKPQ